MVSVVIPTYNRADKIMIAINSVLNQTYSDLELIVVDDGSTDNTEELLKKINDHRFRYVKQGNAGACAARNLGISLSNGEYIAFHDSDDIWHLDKLEKQVSVMKKVNADVVFCKYMKCKNGEKPQKTPQSFEEGFLNPVRTVFDIGTQTIIGKAEIFKEYLFDVDMPRLQELEMLFRISKKHTIYCMDEALVDYIVGDDSISKSSLKLYQACKLLVEKHPEIIKEYPDMAKRIKGTLLHNVDNLLPEQKKYANDFYKLALQCDSSLRTICVVILKKTNLARFFEHH